MGFPLLTHQRHCVCVIRISQQTVVFEIKPQKPFGQKGLLRPCFRDGEVEA